MTRWHIAESLALLASLGPVAALAQSTDLEPGVQTSPPPAASAAPASAPAAPRATPPAAASQSGAARGGSAHKARSDGARAPAADAAKAAGVATSAGSTPGTGPTRSGTGSRAEDRIELDTTQISGNRELPKVMYVVPWRKADLGDFAGRPPNSLLDEALTPVDRDVFRRQNRYFSALQAGAGDAKSQPGVTGGGAAGAESKDEK